MTGPGTLILYSKAGCHLCDVMELDAAPVARELGLVLSKVDVSADPALEARFGMDVPLLFFGEREVARHRATREQIRRGVAAAAAVHGESPTSAARDARPGSSPSLRSGQEFAGRREP